MTSATGSPTCLTVSLARTQWSGVLTSTPGGAHAIGRPACMSAALRTYRRALGAGRVEHRLDDVVVAGAAAQVALEPVANLFLGWVRVLGQEAGGRHDHAWRAVAALEAVVVPECLLERVQL